MESIGDMDTDNPLRQLVVPSERVVRPIEMLVDLREALPGLRETVSTVHLRDLTEWTSGVYASGVAKFVCSMVGMWQRPRRFGTNEPRPWVFPSATDASYYSDVSVQCECGCYIIHPRQTRHTLDLDAQMDHSDDCLPHHRLRAKADVYEQRRDIIHYSAGIGLDSKAIAPRLGIVSGSLRNAAVGLNVSLDDRREVFIDRLTDVLPPLLHWYKSATLGEAFGFSDSYIRKLVRTETPHSPASILSRRSEIDVETGVHCKETDNDL
jgi:hypothetical protein